VNDRRLAALASAGLWMLLAVFAWQGLMDRESGGLDPVQDHVITWSFSRQVADTGAYPPEFTYPLPAVVVKLLLGIPGRAVSSVVWMAVMLLSLHVCLRGLLGLLGHGDDPRRRVMALLGVLAVVYFVQWDFRAMNANTVFMALVVGSLVQADRGRAGLAGFLLASSIALKLYSVVLVPYLLWRRRGRELMATLLGLVFWFGLVPILYFGPGEASSLTRSWLGVMLGTLQPHFAPEVVAYKVSLHSVLTSLLASSPRAALLLTRGLQAVWVFAIVVWLARAGRGEGRVESGPIELARTSVLCLAMLFVSPLLEPHHGVLLLLPALLVLHEVFEPDRDPALRRGLAAILVAGFVAVELAPSGVAKGIAVNANLLLFSLAAARIAVEQVGLRPRRSSP